jgi:hypothetical protein
VFALPDGVIDFERALTRRLRQQAGALGVEVLASGATVALYGPDLGSYLYPLGVGRDLRWLSYAEASEALERHMVTRSSGDD